MSDWSTSDLRFNLTNNRLLFNINTSIKCKVLFYLLASIHNSTNKNNTRLMKWKQNDGKNNQGQNYGTHIKNPNYSRIINIALETEREDPALPN